MLDVQQIFKTVYLEAPVPFAELRKTYTSDVEFITDTQSYPNVVGIRYAGPLHKAIKGKLIGKNVGPKVDRLLELYKRHLFRFWDDHVEELVSKLAVAPVAKQDLSDVEEEKKKREVVETVLKGLGTALAADAMDYYKRAYILGKERGVSLSGKDFVRSIDRQDLEKLSGLTENNKAFVDNFMKDLSDKYVEALQKEYQTKEAEEEQLRRITQAHESRLAMYAFAALGAFALGLTKAIREGNQASRAAQTAEVAGEATAEALAAAPEEVQGLIWVTNHDDAVCPGCADNDGKFFTLEEFEAEYQNNECLVRCRCAETSTPTSAPASHFGKSAKLSTLRKGGPGSGCNPEVGHCGRPAGSGGMADNERVSGMEVSGVTLEDAKEAAELQVIGRKVQSKKAYLSAAGTGMVENSKPLPKIEEPKAYELSSKIDNIITQDDWIEKPISIKEPTKFNGFVKEQLNNFPAHLQDKISSTVESVIVSDTLPQGVVGRYERRNSRVLFDQKVYGNSTFGKIKLRQDMILTHELSHALDHSYESGDAPKLSRSRGWKDAMMSGRPLTEYAKVKPEEYFAEAVTGYVFMPEALKASNTKAFDFLEKLFSNKVGELDLKKADEETVDSVIDDTFKDSLVEIITGPIGEDSSVEKGGTGSGCHGPNCGRHASVADYHELPGPRFDIQNLRPTVRYKGKLYHGNKGEKHGHIFDRNIADMATENKQGIPVYDWANIEEGFTDTKNPEQFISREQAARHGGEMLAENLSDAQEAERRGYTYRSAQKVEKGGPGSGCQGPNCGRPATGTVHSKMKMRVLSPDSFKAVESDPVSTKEVSTGKPLDKFIVTTKNEFVPVHSYDRHSAVIIGSGPGYDATTRVIQDLDRKVALIRIGHDDPKILQDAVMGDKTAMNKVIERQRNIAQQLYGKHKGMKVILASGGTWRFDQNNLPRDVDSGAQLPSKPEQYVNAKFIYKV